jgi:archaellum component FlaG (FlaF/FlaG flagellin family)
MNKIFLVFGLIFVVATILFSGCVTSDVKNNDTTQTNDTLNDNTNNAGDNISTDNLTPPEFPKD